MTDQCPICEGMCHDDPALPQQVSIDEAHPVVVRVLSEARRKGVAFGADPDDIDTGELASDILAALAAMTEYKA
jgi:hypothetical protein